MTIDAPIYRIRPEIKEAIKALGITQGEFARRAGYKRPGALRSKLNGEAPMDSAEETKILDHLAAMKGEA